MDECVNIIGGGTAGLIAAKHLARSGINTVVHEKKHRLDAPISASGIISIKGLESLGIGYSMAVTNTLTGARLHAGRKTMKVSSKAPIAHVLDRKALNAICFEEAASAGADIRLGARIGGRELDGFSKAGIVIGADGAVSSVASHFSMGRMSGMLLTYKAVYETPVEDVGLVDLYFDNTAYKGLFAWTCPNAEDRLEVGVGIDQRFGNGKQAFDNFIGSKAMSDVVGGLKPIEEGASIIPTGLRESIVDAERRVLLVGDAAGQIKATTGGGIVFGGNAAIMAAEAIVRHINDGGSLLEYRRVFMKRFGADIGLHKMLRSFYSRSGNRGLELAFGLMEMFGMSSFLGKYGDMDMPTVILKRLVLRGLVD
ncbi:MAG: NAD(P)/FAD-dependent oxidoreductase [Candidatus Micrarchaeota archaeon]|nr:NAD(P)/FAD-dependent oxidoreductase [Candidatus Micrarchaeota archaeon]